MKKINFIKSIKKIHNSKTQNNKKGYGLGKRLILFTYYKSPKAERSN